MKRLREYHIETYWADQAERQKRREFLLDTVIGKVICFAVGTIAFGAFVGLIALGCFLETFV